MLVRCGWIAREQERANGHGGSDRVRVFEALSGDVGDRESGAAGGVEASSCKEGNEKL